MDTRGPSSASDHPSRRRVLALAGAGGAALAASLLRQDVARAGHTPPGVDADALHLGEDNDGTGVPTTLGDSIAEDHILKVVNAQDFGAILAMSGEITGDVPMGADKAMLVISANGGAIGAARLVAEEGPPAIEAHGGGVSPSIMGFGTIVGFGNTREEDLPEGMPLGSGEGVVGMSEQPDKAGVLGESVFLINRGFEGAPPPLGIGVMGRTGTGIGVVGEAFANHEDPQYIDGTGVLGQSGEGTGVEGSSGSGTGVHGRSDSGVGVQAESTTSHALNVIGNARVEATIDPGAALDVTNHATGDGAHAILATTFGPDKPAVLGDGRGGGAGVVGSSSSGDGFGNGVGDGVAGATGSGIAVRGETPDGVGVRGHSDTKIGVWASAPTAVALHVSGRAVFENAGSGVIPAGSNQAIVAAPFVGPDSQVIVTLTGNPGNRELRWVQIDVGVGFTVHLSPAPPNGRPATPFVYVVLDRDS